ncbi:hypothetical protein D3C75_1204470 [compost metagenome]
MVKDFKAPPQQLVIGFSLMVVVSDTIDDHTAVFDHSGQLRQLKVIVVTYDMP